ncbi:MAG: CHASE3 domain-containing protein [Candidatus Peribacteraceae bacterium]|nr:CHASE3 domain-containing protein [Candidatus Peribacteraceae bacterium]
MNRFRTSTLVSALGLVLLVLLLNAGVSFYNTHVVADNMRKVSDSQAALTKVQQTLSAIIDAETGQRGYLLTGQEGYLAPYKESINEIQKDFTDLHTLFAGNEEQLNRLEELKKAYNEKSIEMEQTIALRRTSGLKDAVPLGLIGNGRRQMTIIRRAIAAMENAEKQKLEQKSVQAQTSLWNATVAFYITLLAALGTVAAYFVLLRLYLKVNRQAEKDLHALNEGLEEKVAKRTEELQLAQAHDRANLHRLKSMLAQLPMAALMTDEAGHIIELNEQYCRTFHIGLSAAEAMALPTDELTARFQKSLADVQGHMAKLAVTLDRKKPQLGFDIHLKDGRIVQRDFLPFYDNGKFGGQLFLYRDVTQERRIDAAKSEFMSLASHQLKTPLTSIRWVLSRLSKIMGDAIDEPQQKLLAEGRKGVLRMSDTIDTMLQISRIESGQTHVKTEPIAICDFVQKIIKSEQEHFEDKQQTLTLECDPDMAFVSDKSFLHEILHNLINNAMKYTPDRGTIKVMVEKKHHAVTFLIQDSGYGIPAHQQSKIFSKFFRGDNVVGKVTEGTGLGLYLVHLLTKLLGGTIFYESSEEEGTTFTLTIPS